MQKTCAIAKNVNEIRRFIHNRCRWPLASTAGCDVMDFKIFLKCVKPVGEWLRKREEKKKTGAAREREERIYEVRSQLPPSEFQQKTLYIKIGINMWQGTVWPGSL